MQPFPTTGIPATLGLRPRSTTPEHDTAARMAEPTQAALPGRPMRIWPDHHVQWGVPRKPWTFDIEDPASHSGRTQHAFPLGRDEMAICGFAPPLVKAFVGPPKPLLSLAGPDNPRCDRCARALVPAPSWVPHVSPYAPREARADGRTWLDDRLDALGLEPKPRVHGSGRPPVAFRIDPPWPSEDRPMLALGPGRITPPDTSADRWAPGVPGWIQGAPPDLPAEHRQVRVDVAV